MVRIKNVTITPNPVNVRQSVKVCVDAEEVSWNTIKTDYTNWTKVKNSLSSWSAVKNLS